MIFIDNQNGTRVSDLPEIDRLVDRLNAALLATDTPGSFDHDGPTGAAYKCDSDERLTPEATAQRIHAMVKLVVGPDTPVEYRAGDGSQYIIEANGGQWVRYSSGSGLWYDSPNDHIGRHSD